MGLVTWFRRHFIVPRVGAVVDEKLGVKKGTTLSFLQGYKTYIAAIAGLLTAIVAFIDGHISFGELLMAINVALAAMGLSAGKNRIEENLSK